MRKALLGHVSFETAYEIDDYPYGSLRCKKRVWVETTKHGQRLCEVTSNPKRGHTWNKPHKSTYSEVLVMYLEPQPDGREFVECRGLYLHSSDGEINGLRLLVGDEALRDSWEKIETNRKIRDVMNNAYRKPEERVRTGPLPPLEVLVAGEKAAEVRS